MKNSFYKTFCLLCMCSLMSTQLFSASFNPGNWRYSPATTRHILDVQVLNFNTVIVVGGNEFNDAITTVLRTDDRGENWAIIIDIPFSPWLHAVHFPTTTTGFAAGHDGIVLRTTNSGNSWDTLDLPGNAAIRDYNDVYFISATTGFLVGGNQSNDSIQTILKTTDGGNNWQIVRDNLGYWLNSVQFVSATVGFASGENGILLKTVDGGSNWFPLSLQGNVANRHFNDIRFVDEMNGIAVGGNERNDSIRTIIRTQDGGINWTPVLDNVASWLNAIEILPSGEMIVVGNDSTTLLSIDGGATWNNMLIPDSVNFPVHLNSVDFFNADFGAIVGNSGQILFYEAEIPTVPTIIVNTAIIASSDSVWMSGNIWANGSETEIYFDYGPTPSLGFSMDANPSMIAASDSAYVEALLTSVGYGIYYYQLRAENLAGVSLSDIRQLYIGDLYENVNLDFEYWNEETVNFLDAWVNMGNVYSSPSYNGSLAVTLGSGATDSVSAIIFGNVDNEEFGGGIAVSSLPDSIVGYFNYDITPGTDALILIVLKKSGAILSIEPITFSGSSSGVFERLSFPISYSGPEIPDSIVIGVANNNAIVEPPNNSIDNVVSIDDLFFISSIPIIIPNSDFELWSNVEIAQPTNWFSKDSREQPALNRTIFRTEDAQHGNYAVIVQNDTEYQDQGELNTHDEYSYNIPSFALAGRHTTFNGYYKYDMQGVNDTLNINVIIFQNGSMVGGGRFIVTSTVVNYTPFQMALTYIDGTVIPDSASISFRIGNDFQLGASVLTIDNLSFDGFVSTYEPLITAIEDSPMQASDLSVYPNPTDGLVWIASASDQPISNVMVYNLQGALVYQRSFNSNRVQIDIKDQPAGIYFLQLFSEDGMRPQTRKLIRY